MEPVQFILRQGHETLTPLAGLVLAGKAIARFSRLRQIIDPHFPVRSGIPNSDVLIAYWGLLCLGKFDFDAIERFSGRPVLWRSPGLTGYPVESHPAPETGCQGRGVLPVLDESLLQLVKQSKVPVTPQSCGGVALDMDVFTLDNSDTRKEGIGWTYAGLWVMPPLRRIWDRMAGASAWNCAKAPNTAPRRWMPPWIASCPRALQLTQAPCWCA
ncbi:MULTISPECIES: hypothetical protein [Acidithiobacillus]|uniref:Uncharacterized protein n=1 Tax=Acidithiobacillus ferridurans TaxID=1232575 RepID=A0A2Z6III2_ACIFI|nr:MULTISPECIES: hypothetical protein [Acidithiobacillus]MBU2720024.1 hypothetical protein [Acidithiobacillus ferridurans]BBF64504.1 hypothetical protein AFERRID_07220 [Acidithiobacillus ferridurans]